MRIGRQGEDGIVAEGVLGSGEEGGHHGGYLQTALRGH